MLQDVAASRPTLLEIGCGTGAASVRLAEQGAARVTGIDLSPASVGIAVRRAANAALDPAVITFEVGDGASSVLEPHDWVLLDRVICCYPNVTGLLANATSAAGKRIAFAVPESRGWRGMVSTVVLGAENLWNNTFRRATCPGYVHDLGMIESILADAGFHLINQTHRGLWYAAVFDRFT
jgi:magnesium-protoporphyrin O-methyltransferase